MSDSWELCLSVAKGDEVSTKRRNDAVMEVNEAPSFSRKMGLLGEVCRQAEVAAFLRGSSSFSETFNWPRPMPTSMSGLVTP